VARTHLILLDLEFDGETGTLQRTKYVTETEVVQSQLAKFGLGPTASSDEAFQMGKKP